MKSNQRDWGTLEHAWATTFILGYSTLGVCYQMQMRSQSKRLRTFRIRLCNCFFFLGIFLECCQFFTFGAKAFQVSFLAILLKKSKEKKSLMQILGGKLWQKNQSPHHFSSDPTCGIILQNNFFLLWKDWNEEGMPHHQPPSLTPAVAGRVWLDQKQHNAWRTRRLHVGPALSWPFNGRIRLFLHFMLSPK